MPTDLKPRILCTAIDVEDSRASLDLALSVAQYFAVKSAEAKMIVNQRGRVVSTWRAHARGFGLSDSEIARMQSAFEHEDLRQALRAT